MLESSEARVAAASGDPVAALDPLDLLDPLDPVEKATLEVARAIEATDFGAWLREHLVLWNVIAVVALFALGFALALLLRLLFGTLIARALERANRHRTAAAIVESRLVAPLSAIVPLLIVARVLGILGESGIVHPLVGYNVANAAVAIAILRGLSVASRALRIVDDLYSSRPEVHRPEALRGYRQVAMVVLGLVAGISAAAIAVGKSPLVFLAALGAAGAASRLMAQNPTRASEIEAGVARLLSQPGRRDPGGKMRQTMWPPSSCQRSCRLRGWRSSLEAGAASRRCSTCRRGCGRRCRAWSGVYRR